MIQCLAKHIHGCFLPGPFGDSLVKVKGTYLLLNSQTVAVVLGWRVGVMGSETKYNNRSFRKPKKLYIKISPNSEASFVRFIRMNKICVKRITFRKIIFWSIINTISRQLTISSLFMFFAGEICSFLLEIRFSFAVDMCYSIPCRKKPEHIFPCQIIMPRLDGTTKECDNLWYSASFQHVFRIFSINECRARSYSLSFKVIHTLFFIFIKCCHVGIREYYHTTDVWPHVKHWWSYHTICYNNDYLIAAWDQRMDWQKHPYKGSVITNPFPIVNGDLVKVHRNYGMHE